MSNCHICLIAGWSANFSTPRFFNVQITKLQPHGAVRIIEALPGG
jgi:hypothetical protein